MNKDTTAILEAIEKQNKKIDAQGEQIRIQGEQIRIQGEQSKFQGEQIKILTDFMRDFKRDTTKRLDRLENTRISWKVGILSLVWGLSVGTSTLITLFIVALRF